MKKVKKVISCLLVLILLLIGLFYYLADFILEEGSRELAKAIQTRGGSLGVNLQNINFESAKVNYFRELQWDNISAEGKLSSKYGLDESIVYNLFIKRAQLRFSAISKGVYAVQVYGFSIIPTGQVSSSGAISYRNVADIAQSARIEIEELKLYFNLGSYSRRDIIDGIKGGLASLLDLIQGGETDTPVQFKARIEFRLNDKPILSRVKVLKRGDLFRLVMNKEDVKKLSRDYSNDLTDAEILVMAEYPRLVPKLLLLKEYAELKAVEKNKEEAVPEDAYRHVLWSYKLTKEFGAEFAKLVADAHEKEDFTETAADHVMDLNNNALGREFAESGIEENQLADLVFTDKRVVKAP